MRRLQLVELEDLAWFPAILRDLATDYLQMMLHVSNPYAPVAPRLHNALEASGEYRIIDLASGGSGPWARMLPLLAAKGTPVHVTLTDRYPNINAFATLARRFRGNVTFASAPVDARRVPHELVGLRTIFSAFHHFSPEDGRAIIGDAVAQARAIAIFEATARTPTVFMAMLTTPLLVWLLTPLIRPLTPARQLFTYLLPFVPAIVLFDGVVSCLRSYTIDELRSLVEQVPGAESYQWAIGVERAAAAPLGITYCVGVPRPAHVEAYAGSTDQIPARTME
ncbi:MAG: class I SAM-dependent methyltransferase [Chloroflexia bacterium]|nr:class I SAM-dependent methyltransferase [Chloroflexia bacterium]